MTPATLTFVNMALQVLQMLIAEVPQAVQLVQNLQGQMKRFQAENRDPTTEEWQALNSQITTALETLGTQAKLV